MTLTSFPHGTLGGLTPSAVLLPSGTLTPSTSGLTATQVGALTATAFPAGTV